MLALCFNNVHLIAVLALEECELTISRHFMWSVNPEWCIFAKTETKNIKISAIIPQSNLKVFVVPLQKKWPRPRLWVSEPTLQLSSDCFAIFIYFAQLFHYLYGNNSCFLCTAVSTHCFISHITLDASCIWFLYHSLPYDSCKWLHLTHCV